MRELQKIVLVGWIVVGAGCSAVGGAHSGGPGDGNVGTVKMELSLPGGQSLTSVAYTLSDSQKATVQSGPISTANSESIEFLLGDVAAGSGYGVSVTAQGPNGTTCSGTAGPFGVTAHATTTVKINVGCYAAGNDAGNVFVTSNVFFCATWSSLATVDADHPGTNGNEANVGSAVTLIATATGPDSAKLSYSWSSSNDIGTFGANDAKAGSDVTTFTCTAPGTTTITLVVGDGPVPDGASCSADLDTVTTVVTCDAGAPFTLPPGGGVSTHVASAQTTAGALATSTFEADATKQHTLIEISVGSQDVYKVESWALADGTIPLFVEQIQSPPIVLQLSSADGKTFKGTFNGQALQPFPVADLPTFLMANGGIRLADGTVVGPLGDITATQQRVGDALTALNQQVASGGGSASAASPPGDPSTASPHLMSDPPPDPPPYTPLAAATEDTRDAGPCSGCTNVAAGTLSGCLATAAIAATGCTGFYDGLGYAICLAAGAAACTVVYAVQNSACYNQGSGCCPTACGASGCCLAGHTCQGGGSGSPALCCAGHTCGSGCCSAPGDACFESVPSGAFQCCPTGQPLFTGPSGTQVCCQIGDTFNPTTFECCPAGSDCSTCGHAGQTCCMGSRCLGSGLGCDTSSNQCVSCPPPPTPPVQLADQTIFDGNNCFGVNNVHTVGGPCASGFHRVSFETTVVSSSSDTSCTPEWAASDPNDCTVNVRYVTPSDCFKGITCETKVFETNAPPAPGPQLVGDLDLFDGNNCFGVNNNHTVGRACDPGFHRLSFDTTVISAATDTSCTPNWATSDPNDCTVIVNYTTPSDCFKGIRCDTQVFESNIVTAPPLGCP